MSRTNRVSNGFLSFLLRVKGQDNLSSHREKEKGKNMRETKTERKKERLRTVACAPESFPDLGSRSSASHEVHLEFLCLDH